jgi:hypothetical protein
MIQASATLLVAMPTPVGIKYISTTTTTKDYRMDLGTRLGPRMSAANPTTLVIKIRFRI